MRYADLVLGCRHRNFGGSNRRSELPSPNAFI